ncbi:MAG: deoxyguanosinetriphosphate triphosphohydrolase [Halanaerobiales bacterium]
MMIRKMIEERESRNLSSYAFLSKNSKGRRKKIKKCDIRTDFQRDRDRIIHSKAFRRLKHKTQVFIAPEGDHYRTRLTHTLEVSQIARTVARSLRLNEDLTEAIALGHDLGHTPFGHAGEDALSQVYQEEFKHNKQSLRVVEKLEDLNLTQEVKDGILHHTGEGVPETLEGQIVRIADRIAYINHDIDDALRAGIIEKKDLPEKSFSVLGDTHSERIDTMVKDLINSSWRKNKISRSPEIKNSTKLLRKYLFENVYIGSSAKSQENKAKKLLIHLYNFYMENIDKLPEKFLNKLKKNNKKQIVIDYIAGMSDVYAINKGRELFIPTPWLNNK